ncbi:DUF4374 domain-containing protein [Pedobacter psychrodurus]|uniref:DUF4374 domain-containing protein n=1 Tax=Pedobacter psychrodurus TaxID=2530456 RepID=UPI002931B617|nr:DUF4374 domain-containing protein [Pedobacter psychrodurus]
MKTKFQAINRLALAALALTLTVSSCKKSTDGEETGGEPQNGNAFAIVGEVTNPSALYFLTAGTLGTGSVTAVGKGAEITGAARLFKKGYYYTITNGTLIKYKYENSLLSSAGQVAVTGSALYSYWLNDETLIVWNGTTSAPNNVMSYNIVNTGNMSVTKSGSLNLTGLITGDKAIYLSGCILRGSRLYIPYAVYNSEWTSHDISYLAAVDYPAMTNLTISSDTRSAYAGSFSSVIPSTALLNGDIYMLTNTGDRWAVTPNKPSAVYKIKAGENAFDSSYFFDLSAISAGNREFYGFWDLGNGKAITRMGKAELLKTFEDYFATDVFEYYLVDVVAKTKTKLDLPLSKVVHASPVLVENGKAYIAVASSTSGNFVYTYDIASGSLTKGLEIKGVDNVNYISRFN